MNTETHVLRTPAAGVPELSDSPNALAAATAALAAGTGPVAIDTERAPVFRYSARAYLVQLRRAGAGTWLLDPIAFQNGRALSDLSQLAAAIAAAQWVLHSAHQDLPCLSQIGLVPNHIFDTELAAKLLGLPRVSLAALVEEFFGVTLLKEHSAADWSCRPLPAAWRAYAALDVELLIELRDRLATELEAAGKAEWAAQEFAYLVETFAKTQPERPERWRRMNGANQVQTQRGFAIMRELWLTRDAIALELDQYPGHILADAAITQIAALVNPEHPQLPTAAELRSLGVFNRNPAQTFMSDWLTAIRRAGALPEAELPPIHLKRNQIPDVRDWPRVKPAAAALWAETRPTVIETAEQLQLPVENLVSPGALKQCCWQLAGRAPAAVVDQTLAELAVREWQRSFIVPLLSA
ncbi:MAG: ribonuclease D [Propionibacteriaceae bacterium]|jgi:ribonuclease D|nr:ribonuclease D [Propionibacteriaceae bacterium]